MIIICIYLLRKDRISLTWYLKDRIPRLTVFHVFLMECQQWPFSCFHLAWPATREHCLHFQNAVDETPRQMTTHYPGMPGLWTLTVNLQFCVLFQTPSISFDVKKQFKYVPYLI